MHGNGQNVARAQVERQHFQFFGKIVEFYPAAHDYRLTVKQSHHLFQFLFVADLLALGNALQLLFRLVGVGFTQGVDVIDVQPRIHHHVYCPG